MAEGYRTLSSERVYQGLRVSVRRDRVELAEGRVMERETVEHPDAVVVVALDDARNVLLVRQYRAAPRQMLLELPAGTIERGEDPMTCAQRELREETGFAAGHFQPLGEFWTTPGFCTERMYAFLATKLRPDALPADDDEQIEVERMAVGEALEKARTGQLHDAKTIAALAMAAAYLPE